MKSLKKVKFSTNDFFSKSDRIYSFLRIWSHLLKKTPMKIFIFCAVSTFNVLKNMFVVYMMTLLY